MVVVLQRGQCWAHPSPNCPLGHVSWHVAPVWPGLHVQAPLLWSQLPPPHPHSRLQSAPQRPGEQIEEHLGII